MVDASDAKSLLSPATFSRFVFRDRSGTGFSLQVPRAGGYQRYVHC